MNQDFSPPPKVDVPFEVPKKVSVELTITADVTITQELCDGIADQYEKFWDQAKNDPEELAKSVLYALVNPGLPHRAYPDDYWDGVACLDGLVENIELED